MYTWPLVFMALTTLPPKITKPYLNILFLKNKQTNIKEKEPNSFLSSIYLCFASFGMIQFSWDLTNKARRGEKIANRLYTINLIGLLPQYCYMECHLPFSSQARTLPSPHKSYWCQRTSNFCQYLSQKKHFICQLLMDIGEYLNSYELKKLTYNEEVFNYNDDRSRFKNIHTWQSWVITLTDR